MPTIQWKTGTAFDFFVSLAVLHQPGIFGLRPSWAAGVRQRLSAPNREMLEKIQSFSSTPLNWLSGLAEPNDASTALEAISIVPGHQCLSDLTLNSEYNPDVSESLQNIARRGSWKDADLRLLKEHYHIRDAALNPESLTNLVTTWSDAERSGEKYLCALQEYYQVFFCGGRNPYSSCTSGWSETRAGACLPNEPRGFDRRTFPWRPLFSIG
jgi:hypothetical protein